MLRRVVAASICVVLFAGCGETSFLGRRYDNFTAYYNTFYNARKSFDRGVEALERGDEPINQDVFLAIYAVPTRAGSRQHFDDAIRKSADVIRDHAGSRWVDDAVLLIGKSYFYQQNFVSAAQKFREAIALQTELEDEARFWLGYALTANGSLAEARDALAEALDRDDRDRGWEPALNMLLGDVLVRLGEWDAAVAVIREGAGATRDRQAQARARFVLGQIEEKRGAFEPARDAYASVGRLAAPFELGFAARLNELRLSARIGGIQDALGELRRLERDDKYRDRRAPIAYTRARLLHEAGDARAARDAYRDLLYDSDYDVTPVRGRVHHALGMLYRDLNEDFVLAAAHFDTASTALTPPPSRGSGTGRAEPLTVYAITDSDQQAATYGTYAQVYGDVARMDSLLHLGTLPEEEFQDFVHELRLRMQEEMAEREREAERRRGEAGFADGFIETPDYAAAGATGSAGGSEAGFLFHRDPVRVQEGRQAFVRRWGERPLVPGWRRRSSVDAYVAELRASADTDADVVEQGLMEEFDAALPIIDVSDVPRTEAAQQEMMRRRALARYELGNVLFISMTRPDSAAAVYQLVIDEDADLPVAGRAFYALAELERSRGRTADANNLYRIVLERYPGSEFENRVREQLGMEVEVATDSLALARSRFDELMNLWREGDHSTAFSGLIELSLDIDDENVSPAALMAASRIGIEWLRRDSLGLADALPVSVPDDKLTDAGFLIDDLDPDTLGADAGRNAVGIGFHSPLRNSLVIQPRVLEDPEPARSVTVEQLLTRLADVYSASPLASQARSMLEEIEERKPKPQEELLAGANGAIIGVEVATDSIDAAAPEAASDEIAEESDDAAESATENLPADVEEPQEMMQAEMPPSASEGIYSLRGKGGLVPEAGGWTLLVAEAPSREAADEYAAALDEEGFRTHVLPSASDSESFNIFVGQFQAAGLAEAALRTNREHFPEATSVVPVPSVADSP